MPDKDLRRYYCIKCSNKGKKVEKFAPPSFTVACDNHGAEDVPMVMDWNYRQ